MSTCLWVKYSGNDSKRFDGATYLTDVKHIRRRDGSSAKLKVGDAVIVNTQRKGGKKAKGRDWFATIVEHPDPDPDQEIQVSRKRKSQTSLQQSQAKTPRLVSL